MISGLRIQPLFVALFLFFASAAIAQPVLPDITGASDKAINVISWTCQYDGIKSIAVQRSADSVFNYATIGYVKNLGKGPQAYIDGHPAPGNNWYRLYIVFSSDLTWYSNPTKLFVDSAALLNKGVLPPNDSLQKLAAKIKVNTSNSNSDINHMGSVPEGNTTLPPLTRFVVEIPAPEEVNAFSYIKSQYVFTNPFTGHINIEIPEITRHHFSVVFFDQNNKEVLDIPSVLESKIIIDKRNFRKKGLYKFELRQDREMLETGFVTIY